VYHTVFYRTKIDEMRKKCKSIFNLLFNYFFRTKDQTDEQAVFH